MRRIPGLARPWAPLLIAAVVLAGCETSQDRVARKENLLAAAGFDAVPATTPERKREMASLPPDRFMRRPKGDKLVYFYADPLVCDCLYIGDPAAYGRYTSEKLQQSMADAQLMAAQSYENASWSWGPWRPGWWAY